MRLSVTTTQSPLKPHGVRTLVLEAAQHRSQVIPGGDEVEGDEPAPEHAVVRDVAGAGPQAP